MTPGSATVDHEDFDPGHIQLKVSVKTLQDPL